MKKDQTSTFYMALQNSFSNVQSAEDWEKFFQEELKLSPNDATNYANELSSQNITGCNIIIGLSEPGFLNQFNMTIGHQLELKAKFSRPASIKTEFGEGIVRPNNKVPIPTIGMNITQLEFDQFRFEWQKYKEHYNIHYTSYNSPLLHKPSKYKLCSAVRLLLLSLPIVR